MAVDESPISASQAPQISTETVLSMGQVQEQLVELCRPRVQKMIEIQFDPQGDVEALHAAAEGIELDPTSEADIGDQMDQQSVRDLKEGFVTALKNVQPETAPDPEDTEMTVQETGQLLASYWLQSISLAAEGKNNIKLGADLFPVGADLSSELSQQLEEGKGQLSLSKGDLEQVMQEFGNKLKEQGNKLKLPFKLTLCMDDQGFSVSKA